jgi:hypothetical protein
VGAVERDTARPGTAPTETADPRHRAVVVGLAPGRAVVRLLRENGIAPQSSAEHGDGARDRRGIDAVYDATRPETSPERPSAVPAA